MEISNFNDMVWSNYQPLFNFAFKFTKNHEQAEDLFQDTMVKALRFQTQFQEGTNLRSWLFTIMRNTFINSYRAKVKQRELISQEEDLTPILEVGNSIGNRGEAKFIREDIQHALSQVPERYRIAFLMHFEGYKYEEIAQKFRVPLGTVKTYIYMARVLLKQHLAIYKNHSR